MFPCVRISRDLVACGRFYWTSLTLLYLKTRTIPCTRAPQSALNLSACDLEIPWAVVIFVDICRYICVTLLSWDSQCDLERSEAFWRLTPFEVWICLNMFEFWIIFLYESDGNCFRLPLKGLKPYLDFHSLTLSWSLTSLSNAPLGFHLLQVFNFDLPRFSGSPTSFCTYLPISASKKTMYMHVRNYKPLLK